MGSIYYLSYKMGAVNVLFCVITQNVVVFKVLFRRKYGRVIRGTARFLYQLDVFDYAGKNNYLGAGRGSEKIRNNAISRKLWR